MWCSICGDSEDKVKLFDMVSSTEIVKVCEDCAVKERMPIIRKATEFQIKQAERKPTMQERISGVHQPPQLEVRKTNIALKGVVDRNYARTIPAEKRIRNDLIPNFGWSIMRARRYKRVTHEQMARALSVPESAIRFAEQGILPEGTYELAKKIENYLNIKIIKPGVKDPSIPPNKLIGVNPKFMSGVKIGDLQRKEAETYWEDENDLSTDFPEGFPEDEKK